MARLIRLDGSPEAFVSRRRLLGLRQETSRHDTNHAAGRFDPEGMRAVGA